MPLFSILSVTYASTMLSDWNGVWYKVGIWKESSKIEFEDGKTPQCLQSRNWCGMEKIEWKGQDNVGHLRWRISNSEESSSVFKWWMKCALEKLTNGTQICKRQPHCFP